MGRNHNIVSESSSLQVRNPDVTEMIEKDEKRVTMSKQQENVLLDQNQTADQKRNEKPKREMWGNQVEFLLACVGYAVGIGNIWRFPYLTYKNGGGAFLIPYLISLFIAAMPLFYLELCLGQFSSLGPSAVFARISPLFEGIGWGMVIVSFFTSIYYIMLMAWVLVYFVLSFRSELLWASCRNSWNTEQCYTNVDEAKCINQLGMGAKFFNRSCWNQTEVQAFGIVETLKNMTYVSPAEEFWERYVLNLSDGFHDMGELQWHLVLALAASWFLVFLCMCRGVKSMGKAVYFAATFPYVVLTTLLIRGATLEGSAEGIAFYITPNMTKLSEVAVWKDAAVQIFYSLGPAFGVCITMSSYSRFNANCYRDAILVSFINSFTSIFAGFAVFSIAGYLSHELNVPVKDVVRDGTGLAFVAYPEAMVRMPASPIWSALFFFMLILLGLDSQFAYFETALTAVFDLAPSLRQRKTTVVFVTCFLFFLMGLPLCMNGGMYVFVLLNDYSAGYCLILLSLGEVTVVCYVYGLDRFMKDVEMMLGVYGGRMGRIFGPTGICVRFCWSILAPVFLLGILIIGFFFYTGSSLGKYKFPEKANTIGWVISAMSLIWIPIFALFHLIKNRNTDKGTGQVLKATDEWCPASQRDIMVNVAEKELALLST